MSIGRSKEITDTESASSRGQFHSTLKFACSASSNSTYAIQWNDVFKLVSILIRVELTSNILHGILLSSLNLGTEFFLSSSQNFTFVFL